MIIPKAPNKTEGWGNNVERLSTQNPKIFIYIESFVPFSLYVFLSRMNFSGEEFPSSFFWCEGGKLEFKRRSFWVFTVWSVLGKLWNG